MASCDCLPETKPLWTDSDGVDITLNDDEDDMGKLADMFLDLLNEEETIQLAKNFQALGFLDSTIPSLHGHTHPSRPPQAGKGLDGLASCPKSLVFPQLGKANEDDFGENCKNSSA
mmetsp:Transcript_73054/g.171320  ORF Transcript_73054/g.171320 Transcript_73054/m.171320 type:complete len:116 (-) Transcript_73054:86-433(-)